MSVLLSGVWPQCGLNNHPILFGNILSRLLGPKQDKRFKRIWSVLTMFWCIWQRMSPCLWDQGLIEVNLLVKDEKSLCTCGRSNPDNVMFHVWCVYLFRFVSCSPHCCFCSLFVHFSFRLISLEVGCPPPPSGVDELLKPTTKDETWRVSSFSKWQQK